MPAFHEQFHQSLPRLTSESYSITSPATWEYNCIAWALGRSDAWWWPAPGRHWPDDVPSEESISAFITVFKAVGYVPCSSANLEPGVEKIALFAQGNTPTHASRQLVNGGWTSKLGPSFDIEHSSPDDLAGGVYGEVVVLLARRRRSD